VKPGFLPLTAWIRSAGNDGLVSLLVGDAASTPRPHIGFGVSKAGPEAQALTEALRTTTTSTAR